MNPKGMSDKEAKEQLDYSANKRIEIAYERERRGTPLSPQERKALVDWFKKSYPKWNFPQNLDDAYRHIVFDELNYK